MQISSFGPFTTLQPRRFTVHDPAAQSRTCDRAIDLGALSSRGPVFRSSRAGSRRNLAEDRERVRGEEGNENSNFDRVQPASFILAIRDLNYLSDGHLFIGRARKQRGGGCGGGGRGEFLAINFTERE